MKKETKKAIQNRLIRFFKALYLRLIRMNDSPQRIAIGFGLGAFLGILPGTGPLAALLLAAAFRVNKAAAFLGGLLTNTWLSFLTILLSIKVGSAIMHLQWQEVQSNWQEIVRNFHWAHLLDPTILKLILPVLLGYLVLAIGFGLLMYLAVLAAITLFKHENKSRTDLPGQTQR
ncbi:MAG TPA: DUF2062 domain-containing protein [Candidatus Omnitrophota bacterium]|nr:DUF2062 domain-containing protein [Candidatus Omnitrophota bacterium]HRZ14816.1 DUF2062 domain-containing protein [Candidatus Omnitrophota bacterium]